VLEGLHGGAGRRPEELRAVLTRRQPEAGQATPEVTDRGPGGPGGQGQDRVDADGAAAYR
jgi:hypothetical protein